MGRGGSAVNFKHQRPHSGLCASRAYFISECSLSLIAASESRDTHAHVCFLGEACRGDYPRVSSAAVSCKTVTSHLQRKRGAARQNGRIRGRAHGPEPERRCASSVLCVSSPFACPVFGLWMKAAHLPCQHVLIATASLQPTQPEPKGRGCARGSRVKLASASLAAKRR